MLQPRSSKVRFILSSFQSQITVWGDWVEERLDKQRNDMHAQFSQFLFTFQGGIQTSYLKKPTIAVTTRLGTTTHDPPYPSALAPSATHEMTEVERPKDKSISTSFLKAMIHMPKEAKVLEDLLSHREELKKQPPQAVIYVHEGKLSLRVGSETITFSIGKSTKSTHSRDDYLYCADYTVKLVKEQWVDTIHHDGEWVDTNEKCNSKEIQAVLFYPRQEQVEPFEWKAPETRPKPSISQPPKSEIKELPEHLEYAFIQRDDQLPVFISSTMSIHKKAKLLEVMRNYMGAIACSVADIKGHYGIATIARKVYEAGFYRLNIFCDAQKLVHSCDTCQRSGKISARNEMPQNYIQVLQINELDELRLDAYESSTLYKERTKKWHDKGIRPPMEYEKEDKEEVSYTDDEMVEVKVLIALSEDERMTQESQQEKGELAMGFFLEDRLSSTKATKRGHVLGMHLVVFNQKLDQIRLRWELAEARTSRDRADSKQLIPQPKKDVDVYLRPLIDDLKKLWKCEGVKTIDVVTGTEFKMRAMLLWTINDFLAQSSLFGEFHNSDMKQEFPRCNGGRKVKRFVIRKNITQIWACSVSFKDQPYILAIQVKQVFYLEDLAKRPLRWKVIQDVNNKKSSSKDVIVVEYDHDLIHDNNSSDLTLHANLNDLDFATLNINGQSTKVEAPPLIIPIDDDDDFIDDEDDVPYELADSNNEVLINSDDDDEVTTVQQSRAVTVVTVPVTHLPFHFRLNSVFEDWEPEEEGGIEAGRACIKPQKIEFKWKDQNIMPHIGNNVAWFGNFIDELVREFPMHYPSWYNIEETKKAHIQGRLVTRRTLPEPLPMLKTRLIAGSLATIDVAHWLSLEINIRGIWGANMPTGVPYTKKEIHVKVIKGKQRGHMPGRGMQVAGMGKIKVFGLQPQGYCAATVAVCFAEDMSSAKPINDLTFADHTKLRGHVFGKNMINFLLTFDGKMCGPARASGKVVVFDFLGKGFL
nr:hypothetical protein [Tanacetum cinerariifolium]